MAGKRIFIGVAWPYANNSIHLGHVAGSLLAPDIFARYHRLAGYDVLMVSGSDEHGTPITVTAEKVGKSPREVADHFHKEHSQSLKDLGISFDLFDRTSSPDHIEVVHDMFLTLLENDYIYRQEMTGLHCDKCDRFLPDRYVEGICPHCESEGARGDQCDDCGKTLDPEELLNPRCKICGSTPESRPTEHFFLKLSALQGDLEKYLEDKDFWKVNVINFTKNWLKEGLKDRAITRDLTWGIKIPLEGKDLESKRIYVWFEAVIGYLSMAKQWSRMNNKPDEWEKFWKDSSTRHYYFLGKDNIPFHTIIWPGMLIGYGGLNLPYNVPANEYLTMGGEKLSKSRGHVVPVPYCLEKLDPDAIRYFLTVNMPELHDSDFTFAELIRRNNDELLNTLGNFVHRVLLFTFKNFGEIPPPPPGDDELLKTVEARISEAKEKTGKEIEACQFKNALREVMALAQFGNGFMQEQAPWAIMKKDREKAGQLLNTLVRIVQALAVLGHPILPFSTGMLWEYLGYDDRIIDHGWEAAGQIPKTGQKLRKPNPLYKKLDPSIFEEETSEFNKLVMKVGKIKECKDHPNADKLQVITVNLGDEERQMVTGLKDFYSNEQLDGKIAIFLTNLKPAKLRGVKSNGMIMAAEDGKVVSVMVPAGDAKPGQLVTAAGIDTVDVSERPKQVTIEEFAAIPLRIEKVDGKNTGVYIEDGKNHPLEVSGTRVVPDIEVKSGAKIR
jgi:methionyl-tRNA synthetase